MSATGSDGLLPPDQAPGAPHPRDTLSLYGHGSGEFAFLEALRTGRLHHAWLIHGPFGLGKATLAYRIARFLLAGSEPGCPTLDVSSDHPVTKRIRAGSENRLFVLRRLPDDRVRPASRKRYFSVIRVDDVRNLRTFFQRTPISGGWRIAIVDAADDLNENAANAFLKVLEEPPERSIILLVSHNPNRLPATLLSRCRRLRISPLPDTPFASAVRNALASASETAQSSHTALGTAGVPGTKWISDSALRILNRESDGSPGKALRIHALDGVDLRQEVIDLLAGLPTLDRRSAVQFATSLAGPEAGPRRSLAAAMLERALADLARSAAGAPPVSDDLSRRIPDLARNDVQARIWAEAAAGLRNRIEIADTVNINAAATILAALGAIETSAGHARSQTNPATPHAHR